MSAKLSIAVIDKVVIADNSAVQTSKAVGEERKQESILAPLEKRVLLWLVKHIPQQINPDHLSLIGLLAMFLAGLCYYLSRFDVRALHLVNFALALNWFGDSLDGNLARYRNKQRPKYGFYVDHIIDTFGTSFLIIGLILSGYMSERIAWGMLMVYFMLSINSYLAAYSLGVFSISFWKFSPTEIRIILALGNLVLISHPYCKIMGKQYLVYDVGGVVSIVGMSLMLVVSTLKNTITLYRKERV